MFGHKVPTVYDSWPLLASYIDRNSQRQRAWINEQHDHILAVNRCALIQMKQGSKRTVYFRGGSAVDIPKGNLTLLWKHPRDRNKMQDNYKCELSAVVMKHQDLNVYRI